MVGCVKVISPCVKSASAKLFLDLHTVLAPSGEQRVRPVRIAVAIAMMVGGGRTPPFAAWLGPDWIRARDGQPSSSVEGNFSGRRAHALP